MADRKKRVEAAVVPKVKTLKRWQSTTTSKPSGGGAQPKRIVAAQTPPVGIRKIARERGALRLAPRGSITEDGNLRLRVRLVRAIVLLQTHRIEHLVFLDKQHDRRPGQGQSSTSPAHTHAALPSRAPEAQIRRSDLDLGPSLIMAAVIDDHNLESTGFQTLCVE